MDNIVTPEGNIKKKKRKKKSMFALCEKPTALLHCSFLSPCKVPQNRHFTGLTSLTGNGKKACQKPLLQSPLKIAGSQDKYSIK